MEKKRQDLKDIVKAKYGEIAKQKKFSNASSGCCGMSCCGDADYTIFSEKYDSVAGYNPDADLGLGCGLPTEYANIREGDTVVDLGSGAGNDCFVARRLVGENGKVTGVDFTPEMISSATENAEKLAYTNVEFVFGDIEKMPLESSVADVVVSNCVLNLVPDKKKAFAEIFRILRNGGHFCISDVVVSGELPEKLRNAAEMYAGCVSGAILKDEYLQIIQDAGFENIQVKKEKTIAIPSDLLLKYISDEEIEELKNKQTGVFSITVYAEKSKGIQNNYNYDNEPV